MSLIHDALKSMDAPEPSKPAAAPARAPAPVASSGGRPGWLDAVLAFGAVVAAGILGLMLWQYQTKPKADQAPVAQAPANAVAPPLPLVPAAPVEAPLPAPAAPTAPATAPVPAMDASVVAAVGASPTQPVAPAMTTPAVAAAPNAAPAVVVPRKGSEVTPRVSAPQPAARSSVRPARQAVTVPVEAPTPVVDDTPVELRFARFMAAMRGGQGADAERELAALKERLPAGSIGLLRAQAWFDLRAGRVASAAQMYSTILERMPGDEEASINLASIQAGQNKTEEARATLDAAVRLQPDSAVLRAALAQFTPNARR